MNYQDLNSGVGGYSVDPGVPARHVRHLPRRDPHHLRGPLPQPTAATGWFTLFPFGLNLFVLLKPWIEVPSPLMHTLEEYLYFYVYFKSNLQFKT